VDFRAVGKKAEEKIIKILKENKEKKDRYKGGR
jgi:hypothetical protein